jgi:hypothetical protein
MGRLTKQQQREIVSEFYGINLKTYEVESVSLTRGGMLTKWGKDATYIEHPVAGRQARTEVVIVFGLSEIFEVTQFDDREYTKRKVAELQAKADTMKAAT